MKGTSVDTHTHFDRWPTHTSHTWHIPHFLTNNRAWHHVAHATCSFATQTQTSLDSPQVSVCFRGRGGRGRQLRDTRWQICLTPNVHLSAYWRALSQWWFMLQVQNTHTHTHYTLHITSNTTWFQHLPVRSLGSNTHRRTWAALSPLSTQSGLQRERGGIWENHLFSFTPPSFSQRKIILYIYEWSCLPVYTHSSCF